MRLFPLFITAVILLSGCNKRQDKLISVDLGKAKYYEPFLWVKSDTIILEKSFLFKFNNYARAQNSKVCLTVVNSKGDSYPEVGNSLVLWLNGERLYDSSNQFEINSQDIANDQTVTLGFQFLPGSKEAKHYLYLQVDRNISTIDRVGNIPVSRNDDLRVMQLECSYEVVWNPLLIGLIAFLLLILALLIIWFVLLRNLWYPKIRGIRNIQVSSPYFGSYKIAGKRSVEFFCTLRVQSKLSKIFKGETVFATNKIWEKPFTIFPGKHNRQLKFKLPIGYAIISGQTKSMPMYLERFGSYEIKTDKKEIIKIKIL